MSVTYSTDASGVKTATFTGTGTLSGATAQLDGATVAIIEGYTSIYQAFQNATSLTSITIPAGVTSIGTDAFRDATSLTSVTFAPNSKLTSIGDRTFQRASSLTSITIPEGVTSIGSLAFAGATSLTSITIPAGVTSIGTDAFFNAPSLTSITVITGNTNYKDISGILFDLSGATLIQYPIGSTRTTYDIQEGVTSIGKRAFSGASSLTSITISANVTSIGSGAFQGSGLTEATINVAKLGQTNFPSALGANQTIGGKTGVNIIGYKVFTGTGTLYGATAQLDGATVAIIEGYTSIGSSAFDRASSLTSITFAEGSQLTSIGDYAFWNASSLTSITIPEGVTSIGYKAFDQAPSLTSITIPASVISIGDYAIRDASSLTSVTFVEGSQLTSIGDNAFAGATSLTSITIPANVTSIGSYAFYNAPSLTSITIPEGVTSIGDGAFLIATSLTSITVNSDNTNYKDISGVLFDSSEAILIQYPIGSTRTTYDIPEGVTSIVSSAFWNASSLTSITIPASVTSIGKHAFYKATNLTSVTFASNSQLTSIGKQAFYGASSLTSITIPASVTSIGEYAFVQASSLTTVYITNGQLGITSPATNVSFFGATVNTEVEPAAAAAAVISDSNFTNVLSNLNINSTGITSVLNVAAQNLIGRTYSGTITIPNGVYSELTSIKKSYLIYQIKQSYATALSITTDRIVVTVSSGSIVANVEVYNTAEAKAATVAAGAEPICFPAGTPVTTDQELIAIDKLNPSKHTIRGKDIIAITQTRPLFKEIVSIEKNALSANVPSQTTEISNEHKVFYKGTMVKARDLVEMCEGVKRIPYNGETLYNVLLKKHDKMMVNNLICETLDPKNIMAKICGGNYNDVEQRKICEVLNKIIKTDNVPAYKKLYALLK